MESKYEDVIQNDHWMWVYDNLNIHQRVRHERQGTMAVHVHVVY